MAVARHSYIWFFPSDWIAGTARMSRLDRSLYFDVCLWNWDKAEPMPRAEQALQFADLPDAKERIDRLVAAGKLKRTRGGALYQERAMISARSAADLHANASAAGSKGAAKRWGNNGKSGSHPIATPMTNQNQNQNQKTPHTPHGGDCLFELEAPTGDDEAQGFETWWREYPNKTGKAKAEKSFAAALEKLSGSPSSKIAQLHFSLRAQKRVWRAKGVEGKYIPHASTWLNQSRWTDDEVVAEATRKIRPRRDADEPEVMPATPKPEKRERAAAGPVGWEPGDGD